ncbi:MAG: VOC family protein [Oscillospiraceae bacterium]|nr:VOC family protein [Oscillospiraceae bacterium]
MEKLIRGIHHVALKCAGLAEFEKTISFYRNVLGLEIVRHWGEGTGAGIMFDTGAGLIEIFASAEGALPQGAIRHVALATDDVDACARAVRAAGYPVTIEPKDIVIGSKLPLAARIAFCTGPVGEEIEFFCEA